MHWVWALLLASLVAGAVVVLVLQYGAQLETLHLLERLQQTHERRAHIVDKTLEY
jgi:hypothetical protein